MLNSFMLSFVRRMHLAYLLLMSQRIIFIFVFHTSTTVIQKVEKKKKKLF